MRISDWSSDVCSSDLHRRNRAERAAVLQLAADGGRLVRADRGIRHVAAVDALHERAVRQVGRGCATRIDALEHGEQNHRDDHPEQHIFRSEEHTSELQSLMRISYAVFCLKNKTQYRNKSPDYTIHNTHTQ